MSLSIIFYIVPGFELLDLSGPVCVFNMAAKKQPDSYDVQVVSAEGGYIKSSSGVAVDTQAFQAGACDSLILVGGSEGIARCQGPLRSRLINIASKKSRRVASVCTGTFLLAEAGLLEGKRATTHWRFAERLKTAYPNAEISSDRIFVQDGKLWTSAGVTAGIDMALAFVQHDYGIEMSREVAQDMVLGHRREGGHPQSHGAAQFQAPSGRVEQVLVYARRHIKENLSVSRLASAAHISERQLSRIFSAELGVTPAKAIERMRVELALPLVDGTTQAMERIAREVGFVDAVTMRQSFIRLLDMTPQALRNSMNAVSRKAAESIQ
ncbi:GlxA family transcriptional regulator [Pseudomonas sp. NPDC085632]|uniref:GlxA family transcriptional regulator n=1 Tax=Pseudomonas sp. NPDC085632 TaxID=3364429 RepID=UPI0037C7013C